MTNFGPVPLGAVLPVFFASYAGSTGASVTLTGLAVTDIEIYKGTSMTQRASDAGYTLLDTDGIDVDGTTGIHAFSIDTGDNTDSGFFAAGSFYTVIVSAVTVDSQTVNFIAATFRLTPAESSAGVAKVDVTHFGGTAGTFSSGRPEVNTTHAAGTAWGSGAITAASIAADAITAAKVADGAIDAATFAAGAINAAAIASDAITAAKIADGAIDAATFASGALDAVWSTAARTLTALDEDSTTLDLDATIRGAVGLASANLDTQLTAIDDYLDTEVAAIKAKTDNLPSDPADASDIAASFSTVNSTLSTIAGYIDTEVAAILAAVDTEVGAIKTVTDKLDTTLEATSDGYHFTETALELAPSGTGASATAIADEVQTRTIAAVTVVNGLANNVITAASLASDAGTEIGTAVWASGTRTLTAIDEDSTTLDLDATIRAAVGLASADLDTQLGDIATDAAAADIRGERTVCRGTVTTGASTTSIPTSAFTPAGAVADQFKGRIVIFDIDTATAALRGQATDITASSNSSTPTFTVTALTSTPASGDTFTIV